MTSSQGGFTTVTPLSDARETLQSVCDQHGRSETIPVEDARGRTLAEDLTAPRAVPHYDRAAMDGFAVQAPDTFDASTRSPVRLTERTTAVEPGTAKQVHTGSALPDGANAVVMVENVQRDEDELLVFDAVATGENVAPTGEDVDAGQQLFEAGHRLSAADLALLRATGVTELAVFERPRVSVIPTGEELVTNDPAPGEMVETNGLTVSALVEQWGGTATHRTIVDDDVEALKTAITNDSDHDIIVTTGGSSVGERDLVPEAVSAVGEVLVHGVALKPGHPVGIGRVGETPLVMLPGYPVSCLINAVQLLRPALASRGGWESPSLPTVTATLSAKLRSKPGYRTFARVTVDESTAESDGETDLSATPLRVSGAGVMSSISFADGWVEIPEQREGIPAGETVQVQQWDWAWRP